MTDQAREAMQLALDAMELKQRVTLWENDGDTAKFSSAIASLRAALATKAEQVPQGWLPIADAPKDGTRVLLWWSHRGARTGVYLDEGWIGDGDRVTPAPQYQSDCTHYMPLLPLNRTTP